MSAPSAQADNKKMPYWLNILVAIDQLGNAIADGNPDNTISARVGRFASYKHANPSRRSYWKILERTIIPGVKPDNPPHASALLKLAHPLRLPLERLLGGASFESSSRSSRGG